MSARVVHTRTCRRIAARLDLDVLLRIGSAVGIPARSARVPALSRSTRAAPGSRIARCTGAARGSRIACCTGAARGSRIAR